MRVVLDSTLRTPLTAKVLSDDAATLILCRPDADPARRRELAAAGVTVREVARGPDGLRMPEVLRLLRALGVDSLLVEGGGRVITSMLRAGAVDRLVVSLSPTIIGAGVEAVGPLGVTASPTASSWSTGASTWPATTSCSASTSRTGPPRRTEGAACGRSRRQTRCASPSPAA